MNNETDGQYENKVSSLNNPRLVSRGERIASELGLEVREFRRGENPEVEKGWAVIRNANFPDTVVGGEQDWTYSLIAKGAASMHERGPGDAHPTLTPEQHTKVSAAYTAALQAEQDGPMRVDVYRADVDRGKGIRTAAWEQLDPELRAIKQFAYERGAGPVMLPHDAPFLRPEHRLDHPASIVKDAGEGLKGREGPVPTVAGKPRWEVYDRSVQEHPVMVTHSANAALDKFLGGKAETAEVRDAQFGDTALKWEITNGEARAKESPDFSQALVADRMAIREQREQLERGYGMTDEKKQPGKLGDYRMPHKDIPPHLNEIAARKLKIPEGDLSLNPCREGGGYKGKVLHADSNFIVQAVGKEGKSAVVHRTADLDFQNQNLKWRSENQRLGSVDVQVHYGRDGKAKVYPYDPEKVQAGKGQEAATPARQPEAAPAKQTAAAKPEKAQEAPQQAAPAAPKKQAAAKAAPTKETPAKAATKPEKASAEPAPDKPKRTRAKSGPER